MPTMATIPPCTVQQRAKGSVYQITRPRDRAGITGHSQNIQVYPVIHYLAVLFIACLKIYVNIQLYLSKNIKTKQTKPISGSMY